MNEQNILQGSVTIGTVTK